MTIRDILLPLLSYPAATTTDSVEKAVAVASELGAHIIGVTFELQIRSPVGLYAHLGFEEAYKYHYRVLA